MGEPLCKREPQPWSCCGPQEEKEEKEKEVQGSCPQPSSLGQGKAGHQRGHLLGFQRASVAIGSLPPACAMVE